MTLREKYEKETGKSVTDYTQPLTLYPANYVLWLEAKLTKKEKPKATLFRDSEWFDLDKFAIHMGAKYKWNSYKTEYYYNAMLDWSDGITSKKKTPQTAIDWVRTALAWERKEKFEQSGYYKNNKAESRVAKDLETMKRMNGI